MVAIRGAICVAENSANEIKEAARLLLGGMMEQNNVMVEDIISVIFSATKDLNKAYPAPVARELGIVHAGLMCVQEMEVEGSLSMCLRILMILQKDSCQSELKHVYLNGAEVLRPDLMS